MNGDHGIYEYEEPAGSWTHEEEEFALADKAAARHTIFQIVVALVVLATLFLTSGCSVDISVPNSFQFNMYEDCSFELIETGLGVQLVTGTTGCNDAE